MSELLRFFKDMRDNGYGLAEIAAQLGTSAIAEPVAGFAAMYDPAHGADAIREGMTYQPRTQAAQEYSQSIGNAASAAIKPAMPIIDTWKKGVDIAGQYSPVVGAALRTVPTAIGIAMGAKPALQAGRQVSNSLGAMQGRMIANANAPRTLNTGFRGQRGAIGTLSTDDDLRALARFNQMDDVYKFDNSHEYYDPIDKLVARNLSDDSFDFMELPTSYGKMSITPSAKEQGKWQVTQWAKDGNPLSDSGNLTKEKALRVFFEDSRPELLSPPKRPLTEFEQAHLLAQQRAALPVNQRGLDLPADNTAMDRAKAMGWDTDVYHGSAFDIENIDTSRSPFYTTEGGAPHEIEFANNFANTKSEMGSPKVYPLLLKKGQITDTRKGIPEGLQNAAEDSYAPLNIGEKGLPTWGNVNSWARRAKANGEKGVLLDERPYLNSVAVLEPSMVRSRFAAFDPFNRDSSNLLAQSAKLAPTTALGAYMYNEKRKKSQGNQ